jgi:hypothetical protein
LYIRDFGRGEGRIGSFTHFFVQVDVYKKVEGKKKKETGMSENSHIKMMEKKKVTQAEKKYRKALALSWCSLYLHIGASFLLMP